MNEPTPHPASPCTSLCVLDRTTGWCEGCGRTLDEIARWSAMTASEKWALLREIDANRKRSGRRDG